MTATLVVGPEASGTRMVTRLLIAGGAGWEPGASMRPGYPDFEGAPVWDGEGPLAVHRSLPYAGSWPDVGRLADSLSALCDGCRVVVVTRPTWALLPAQVTSERALTLGAAKANAARALASVFADLASRVEVPWTVTSAGELHDIEGRARLLSWCGLDRNAAMHFAVRDEDYKHIRETTWP